MTSIGSPVTGRRTRRRSRQWGVKGVLALLVALTMFPYLFMIITSAKDNLQIAEHYWQPVLPIHWSNYSTAWQQIQPYMISSVIVAAAATVGIVILSLIAGFVLARYSFPGRRFFFVMIAALLMVPSICALIPLFVMMRDLKLLNTYAVLILPHIAGGCVLGTILMKTFIEGIPQELFDAARMDGAGGIRIFTSIMAPLSLPVIGTVALITVNGVWNDFFWPLLTITKDELRTVSVGLLFFNGQSGTEYGPMFAGYLLASLPLLLLFTFLSKHFLAGVQGGLPGSH
ncbi:carbohydrate ABC transporter permease [Microlunatus parietis]|uniref:ABC-type glycerol-3-phosphate transport system permease component n=1 Tax=Microlunatus parietis TaxID=682979 RepID=A0A7Y9IE71_9ACTN|nr:carbohydrate ABC transporter permease [Microlunatus parietis]NYE74961.1 ABC-type glycerol-3-phosphate transport system permease component [Microlunatus parietis]